MMTETQDLWPSDIGVSELVSPVSILRKQASFLGMKTKNLVEGKVELTQDNGKNFQYVFYLVAPALKNYRYRLFIIIYPVEFYPVTIDFEAKNKGLTAKDYDDYLAKLKGVLTDEKTTSVIKALISQSQE